MFEEIEKQDKKLPDNKEIKKKVKELSKKYNLYQIIAVLILGIGIIIGIIVGNHYSVCSSYSKINNMCLEQSFNFGIMILIWMIAFIIGVIISALGKIIELLNKMIKILDNNGKKK